MSFFDFHITPRAAADAMYAPCDLLLAVSTRRSSLPAASLPSPFFGADDCGASAGWPRKEAHASPALLFSFSHYARGFARELLLQSSANRLTLLFAGGTAFISFRGFRDAFFPPAPRRFIGSISLLDDGAELGT